MIKARNILFVLALFAAGCITESATLKRARSQLDQMKPTYDRGVETYPNEIDKKIRRDSWTTLETLLGQPQ